MKTVTVKAFVEAVTGNFVSVESTDHYGISLDIPCAKVNMNRNLMNLYLWL